MPNFFLDYLYKRNLITQNQLDVILDSDDIEITKNELFFVYFYNMTTEKINQVNSELPNYPGHSFEDVALILKYIDFEDLRLNYEIDSYLTEFKQAQKIINLGIMSLEEICDHLTNYKVDDLLGNIGVGLSIEDVEKSFVDEYFKIVSEQLYNIFEIKTAYDEVNVLNQLHCEAFIWQEVKSENNISFFTGISVDIGTLQKIAKDFYKIMTAELNANPLENTKEAALDFFSEFLNNTNSACTYKFKIDFDLGLPSYSENTTIKAPKIYGAIFKINSDNITVCIIPGTNLEFF